MRDWWNKQNKNLRFYKVIQNNKYSIDDAKSEVASI